MIESINMENIKDLKKKLYKIQCQNWIKSKIEGKGAIGETLELLLGKDRDNYSLPDYNGIEIKCKTLSNKYPLHLFCCTFDGRPLEMQRLLKIGGYPDKNNSEFNVFNITVYGSNKKLIRNHAYQLKVDYKRKRVKLVITYRNTNRLVTYMSWSFVELEMRLTNKLKYLVIVPGLKSKINNNIYFKYLNPTFYKLISFETFLNLVETGIISVTFKLSYYHSKERYGQFLDKGTSFDIYYYNIEKLFKKINVYM
ncbi:MAG: hypothetical protein IJ572_03170 [Bacilli bacterium]|nr:hypothetical protein [Bacilli bacterium]